MSTITLPNIRVGSDLQVRVRLKDGGVAIDWSTLQNIKACIYSDAQRALAGRCAFSIDEEDNTLLVCTYAANKPQYLGVCRIVVSAKYMGETKTYDKPAFNFVRWTADQDGEQITIDDPDVDVEIDVADVSSSLLDEAIRAAFTAAEEAVDAKGQVLETEAEVEAAEALRVSAEESRVEAEEGRAEAEAARVDEEAVRVSAEDARVVAENARAAAEDLREGAEDDRAAAETARETAEAARVAAEALRVTAEGSRETAEAAREAQASADHTVAAGDHTQAAADHTQAAADHTTAASDHTQAGADHTLAAADHVTAGEDHAQAQDDHEVMAGYDTRLGNVEGEVSQLEAKVDGVTTKNYTEGYKVLQSGALEEDATSVVCDKVPVSFGDVLSLNKAYSYLCAYDANDVKLDHWSARASVSLTATADQNVAYVLCSFLKTNLATAYIKKGSTTLWKAEEAHSDGLTEKVVNLENTVGGMSEDIENAVAKADSVMVKIDGADNFVDGYKVNQDGTLEEDSTSIVSEKITAAANDTFTLNNAYSYICAYDANGLKLDHWSARDSITLSSSADANTAYILVSVLKANMTTAYVKRNGETAWKPTHTNGLDDYLEPMKCDIFDYSEKGNGNSIVTIPLDIKQGHSYRLVPVTRYWDTDGISDQNGVFWVKVGNTEYFAVRKNAFEEPGLNEYYDFSVTTETSASINIRAKSGEVLQFRLLDKSETLPEGNYEKILSDEARISELENSSDIITLHPPHIIEPILANLQYYKNPSNWQNYGDKPLTLLFFSDLHACSIPLQRIMRFANAYGTYIDDVVCGGDMVNSFTNGFDFWAASGAQKILPVIGNHEVIGGSPSIDGHAITSFTKHSAKALYEMVVAPFLAQTGITVDEDKCYWYKDYDSCKIRVIALDIYHYNDTITVEGGATYTTYPDGGTSDQGEQETWFAETLAEAKTKNYAVICLRHGPFLFDLMENPFTSMEFQNTTASGLINPANNSVVNMVQDFIDGGGVFLAWLTGHIHQDAVGTVKDFPDQFQMTIDTSRYHYNGIDGTFLPYGSNIKIEGRTKAADCFDIFSVDTYKKNLTLFRVGSEYDRNGRHIGSLVYNYEEKRLIYV